MVLSQPTRPPVTAGTAEPALVVPDPRAWALWGRDLVELGIVETAAPMDADALVVPEAVPAALEDAVRAAWEQMPPPRRLVQLRGPAVGGRSSAELVGTLPGTSRGEDVDHRGEGPEGGGNGAHGGDGHGDHGGHDHGDMMEITGEPSSDGLVMESIALEHGPLAPGLPGGLVIALELDGDVVASCELRATLIAPPGGVAPLDATVPDPLSAIAWRVALRAGGGGDLAIAALEWERALSHLLWLESVGLILGWDELARRARRVARPLIRAHAPMAGSVGSTEHANFGAGAPQPEPLLGAGRDAAVRLYDFLDGNRRLAARTRGRAVVSAEEADRRRLRGPSARASGLPIDSRADDPAYRELGFEVRTTGGGDAEARVLQRAGEVCDALAIALTALERTESDPGESRPSGVTVESPRGPIQASAPARGAPPLPSAPGAAASRGLAGELAVGLEWAAALVCIASFDISPWEVPG